MPLLFWLDLAAYSLSTLIAAALALMALGTGPKQALNRRFALFALAAAAWTGCALIMRLALWLNVGNPALWGELASLAFFLLGPLLLMFTVRYVDHPPRWADLAGTLGLVSLVAIAVPLFRHQLVYGHHLGDNGTTHHELSALGAAIALAPLFYLAWSLVLFWMERRRTGELYLAGSVLILLAGLAVGGVLDIPIPILSFATLLSVGLLGYGIVSRQLLNPLRARTAELQQEVIERARIEAALQTSTAQIQDMLRAVQESEERFRTMFESAPIGIGIVDANRSATRANRAFHEILDATEEGLRDMDFMDYVPAQEKKEVGELFRGLLDGERDRVNSEMQFHIGGGRLVWTRLVASAVRDAGGEFQYLIVMVEDITERKRAERLLAGLNQAALAMERATTPEEIYTTIAQEFKELGIFCAVLLTDEDQGSLSPTYMNYDAAILRAAEKVAGIQAESVSLSIDASDVYRRVIQDRETILVESAADLMRQVLPGPAKRVVGQIARLLKVPRFILAPLVVDDRVIGAFSVQSDDLSGDDLPSVTAFAHQLSAAWRRAQLFEQAQQEIAERRRAQEALRKSEERFRALIQNSSDIIVLLDAGGTVRYISPAADRILGYPDGHFFDEDPFAYLHPEDLTATQAVLAESQRQPGIPFTHQFRFRHARGEWVHLETMTNNLLGDPSIGAIVINARDVTERERLLAQFLQAQKMEAIGRLASGVAHDFNNLLTVVNLSTRLMERQLHAEDPLREHTQQIWEAGERGARLVQQLLSFSRPERIKPQLVDLSLEMANLSQMLQRIIGEDVELVTVLAEDLKPVRIGASHLEQVIVNLTVNARDAMPRGGRLIIKTANAIFDEASAAQVVDLKPGAYVTLSIADTGTGMDEEIKAHLFEPFFTTKGQGSGLGLATVYGIVKQHRGHIQVYSEAGQGATFKIYLPWATESSAADQEQRREAQSGMARGSETILVVEDEADVRKLIVRILEGQGYRVLLAANGREALQINDAYQGPIDLLLTDVVMPGMNGRDLAAQLQHRRSGLPVLYISGYSDEVIAHHDLAGEDQVLLSKPFDVEDLAQTVRAILDAA